MAADIDDALTPEQVMEKLKLRDRDAAYAILGEVMADGQTLGFRAGRLWRCSPDRLRRYMNNELNATVDSRRPAPSQRALLKDVKSIIRR